VVLLSNLCCTVYEDHVDVIVKALKSEEISLIVM
jgi:hypothetical protein